MEDSQHSHRDSPAHAAPTGKASAALNPLAALSEIENIRRTTAQVTMRSVWVDTILAAGGVAGFFCFTYRTSTLLTVGFFLFIISAITAAVVGHRGRRRQATPIFQDTSFRTSAWKILIYVAIWSSLSLVTNFSEHWQLWQRVPTSILFGVAIFGYLRWDARREARQLASGAYDRSDLL
ncbi:MAG: hypothetical protein QM705_16055 [Ancrocorticia sp.]